MRSREISHSGTNIYRRRRLNKNAKLEVSHSVGDAKPGDFA